MTGATIGGFPTSLEVVGSTGAGTSVSAVPPMVFDDLVLRARGWAGSAGLLLGEFSSGFAS